MSNEFSHLFYVDMYKICILNHTETYGGMIMKKIFGMILLCLLSACSSPLKEGKGTFTSAKGEQTNANIKMQNETIKEVELDETYQDTTKKTLGNDYHMKDASAIRKEWDEQVRFLEKYIEKNGMQNIQMDEEGKAVNEDIRSGCTISIDKFIKAIEDAQKNMEE